LKTQGPCNTYIDSQTLKIETPEGVGIPMAQISVPQQLGTCQNLVLASTSYGYKDLDHKWIHINESNHQFSLEIAELLENNSNTTIEIPAQIIPFGTLKFLLNVKDIFGQESITSIIVEKIANSEVPELYFHTSTQVTTNTYSPLVLQVRTKFPECISHEAMKLAYSWTSNPPVSLDSTQNTPSLYIAPFTLQPGVSYQFTLTVSLLNETERGSSEAHFNVNVTSSPLVAMISGGKERIISSDSNLRIDASGSYDPDWSGVNPQAKWEWKCCTPSGNNCSYSDCNSQFSNMLAPGGPILEKTQPLPIGTFRFELKFSVGEREAHDSVTITIQPGAVPEVQIVFVSDSYPTHNPRRPLILHGIVLNGNSQDVSFEWSVISGNLTLDQFTAPYGTTQRELYIAANVLHEPQYSFRLSATIAGKTGHAEITVKVSQAPIGGMITVHPVEGNIRSLLDKITLSTSGWITTADQLPLQYLFYISEGNVRIPLHVLPTSLNTLSFVMPYYDKPQIIRFGVSAIGKNGVSGEATSKSFQVLPFSFNSESEIVFSEKLFNESYVTLTEEKNFDESDLFVFNIAKILQGTITNTTEEIVHQRRILNSRLLKFYADIFKSTVRLFNTATRIKVTSTLSMIVTNSKLENLLMQKLYLR
jgi:hypothetical protein